MRRDGTAGIFVSLYALPRRGTWAGRSRELSILNPTRRGKLDGTGPGPGAEKLTPQTMHRTIPHPLNALGFDPPLCCSQPKKSAGWGARTSSELSRCGQRGLQSWVELQSLGAGHMVGPAELGEGAGTSIRKTAQRWGEQSDGSWTRGVRCFLRCGAHSVWMWSF